MFKKHLPFNDSQRTVGIVIDKFLSSRVIFGGTFNDLEVFTYQLPRFVWLGNHLLHDKLQWSFLLLVTRLDKKSHLTGLP